MGIAQQKEASVFFTEALSSSTPPDLPTFLAKARQYERQLCGGSELAGVAEPVALAILNAAVSTHQGQLRWLFQLCSRVLHGTVEHPTEAMDAATSAVVHLTELLLRQLLRLTKGQSAVLVGVLELGGQMEAQKESTNANTKSNSTQVAMTAATTGSLPAAAAAASSNDLVNDDAAAQLCEAAFALLIDVAPSASTVTLHVEVLRLLLTLMSSALHHSTEFREDTMDLFTELMMSSPQLDRFVEALLKMVVAWGKSDWDTQAPLLYHEGCQPSIRNFFQVFSTGGPGGASSEHQKKKTVPYVLEVDVSAAKSSAASSGAAGAAAGNSLGAGSSASAGIGGGVLRDPASVLLGSCSVWEQLGRHASALLCVLIVHQKGGGRNPALEYIVALQDGNPVSFVQLLAAIRWKLTRYPEISILLYVLLHDHHEFLHTVLTEDAALLVSTMQQLLELTYKTCKDASRPAPVAPQSNSSSSGNAADGTSWLAAEDVLQTAVLGCLVYHLRTFSYPFINFMSSTLLLLTSQDCVVNRLLCDTPCLPGHLLERYDANAPVGALAVVVLALGITKGFNERNEALIAVFAPCLVNMAPFVHDIDPYSAQRVSGLLTLVLKKMHRASAILAAATAETSDNTGDGDGKNAPRSPAGSSSSNKASVIASAEEAHALGEILAMYVRQLRTIVEGVEALLRGANRRNEHLVYELLYARDKLIDDVDAAVAVGRPFAAQTKQLLVNIVAMIKNCEADIASSDQAQNTQEIIAILRRGQRQGTTSGDGMEGAQANPSNGTEMRTMGASASTSITGQVAPTTAAAAAAGSNGGLSQSPGPDSHAADVASVDLVYSYEESPHSYDFFGPFVWSILLSASRAPGGALWCHRSSELALFPH